MSAPPTLIGDDRARPIDDLRDQVGHAEGVDEGAGDDVRLRQARDRDVEIGTDQRREQHQHRYARRQSETAIGAVEDADLQQPQQDEQ